MWVPINKNQAEKASAEGQKRGANLISWGRALHKLGVATEKALSRVPVECTCNGNGANKKASSEDLKHWGGSYGEIQSCPPVFTVLGFNQDKGNVSSRRSSFCCCILYSSLFSLVLFLYSVVVFLGFSLPLPRDCTRAYKQYSTLFKLPLPEFPNRH